MKLLRHNWKAFRSPELAAATGQWYSWSDTGRLLSKHDLKARFTPPRVDKIADTNSESPSFCQAFGPVERVFSSSGPCSRALVVGMEGAWLISTNGMPFFEVLRNGRKDSSREQLLIRSKSLQRLLWLPVATQSPQDRLVWWCLAPSNQAIVRQWQWQVAFV